MKKLMVMVAAVLVFCGVAEAKYESSVRDAAPVVIYGSDDSGSTITRIAVDDNGNICTAGSIYGSSTTPVQSTTTATASAATAAKNSDGNKYKITDFTAWCSDKYKVEVKINSVVKRTMRNLAGLPTGIKLGDDGWVADNQDVSIVVTPDSSGSSIASFSYRRVQ